MGDDMTESAFHLLINADSATANALGHEKIDQIVSESGLNLISFDYLPAESFHERLEALLDSPYPILIGGGDGTIAMSSARHLEKKKPFGIIPMGTMNLLAIDLNLPTDFAACLQAYKESAPMNIDIGIMNDRPFLCCVSWGTMPEAAKFRETQRGKSPLLWVPKLMSYVFRQMDRTHRKSIRLTLDGHTQSTRTAMLIVSNNLYSNPSLTTPFRKGTLADGILGVYKISPRGFLNKTKLFINMKLGLWHIDPHIREYKAHKVTINTRRAEDLISLDGEPMRLRGPYHISLLPQALSIIIPVASTKAEAA